MVLQEFLVGSSKVPLAGSGKNDFLIIFLQLLLIEKPYIPASAVR